ncbi:hypothetical protein THARTR1_07953 [Trichoderma harzianum]|uniref:Xylanolytic transcriptional activator regulatory domain-containing protein n=1 Tax=Trichoderma harzianum TaxID=5544 RepID=A0A2K0U0X2_TRIHA|nr:hypothetical protein THARTR1_07953 [Trichoderma harzianum]
MERARARAVSIVEFRPTNVFTYGNCVRAKFPRIETQEHLVRTSSNKDLVQRVRRLEESLALPNSNPNSGSTLEGSDIASRLGPSSPQPSSSSTIRAQPRRLVGSDGSLLLRSGSGYERYMPFSSQLASTLGNISFAKDLDSDIDNFDTGDEFIFPHKGPQHGELLSILPPMSSCEVLKDIYLRVFAQLFHVLHDPSFYREYAQFRVSPEGAPLSWLALLFAILSVAVMALEEEDACLLHDLGSTTSAAKNIDILTSRYRAAAMQALQADNYLWRHTRHTLQALIIIIYSINHSHGSSWTLLGMARNIAFSLGCHVDPDNFDLGLVETEERRRC